MNFQLRHSSTVVFIILQLAVLCLTSESDPQHTSYNTHNVDGGVPRLVSLGIVDGKAYFIDQTRRIWNETDVYCKSFGMEMGTITTSSQLSFIKSKYSTTFESGYWLGARDALLPRQFSWEGSGSEVTTLDSLPVTEIAEPLSCLAYNSQAMPSIVVKSCTSSSMQALCELNP